MRRACFIEVETSMEPALTILEGPLQYAEFVCSVILRQHLRRIPDDQSRTAFVAALTSEAATDDPPFSLDYWRLNLSAKIPEQSFRGQAFTRKA